MPFFFTKDKQREITHCFISLHDLPCGGEDHWRREEITDVTAVGPHGWICHQPGGPVLYVEDTPHTVLALVISDNRHSSVSSQYSPVTSQPPYLSSNSVVPLSERPSSTRVRLDNLEY